MINKDFFAKKRILTVVMLAVVMAVGFYLRVDDFGYWQKNRSEFFFQAESLPVAINPDAYYYIDIADEYLLGKVRKTDDRRQFPGSFRKPLSLPLLSVVIASLSKLTDQPVEWVAALLPVFCGIILAIPLYFLTLHLLLGSGLPWKGHEQFNHVEVKIAGFIAGLLALLSPALLMRSSLGWCDTDMLHVSFASVSVMLAVMVMKADNQRNFFFLQSAWTLNLFLFLWWWDFAFWPATFLAGFPWLIALVLIVLDNHQEKRNVFFLLFSAATVLVLSILFSSSGGLISTLKGLYNYVFEVRVSSSSFPIPAQHVSEQGNVNFMRLAIGSSGGVFQLIFSLAGLALLGFSVKRKILILLPLILVGALSVSGDRFMIFTAPLFALGGAVLVLVGWRVSKNVKIKFAVAGVLALFMVWGAFHETYRQKFVYPRTKAALFEGMKESAGDIAENGVIWASWGHGHPLVHYTNKKTIGDGVYHPASLLYIQNFPLATSSFRLSANWISFYAERGKEGLLKANLLLVGSKDDWAGGMPRLQELLAVGPEKSRELLQGKYKLAAMETEDLLAFLFPTDTPPVYLFLDYMYLRERWYFLGKWDLANGRGPDRYTQLRVNPFVANGSALKGKNRFGIVHFDLRKGVGSVGNKKVELTRLVYEYNQKKTAIRYPGLREGYVLYVNKNAYGEFCLFTDYLSESVFLKLFFEKKFDQEHFRPVKDKSPLYLLCEVVGDKYVARVSPDN